MRHLNFKLSLLAGMWALSGCAARPAEPSGAPAGDTAVRDGAARETASGGRSASGGAGPASGTAGAPSGAAGAAGEGGSAKAAVAAGALSAAELSALKPYPERWYADAVMYEVMVRSFQDSDGDGIGDLKGLISRLDYLNTGDPASTTDLKVDGIWLMPIFKSPSYHGYDATDYYQIDPKYGSMEDFKTLVSEARRRNIRILVDLVLNHCSNQHPWFQESGQGPESKKRDWFVWRKDDPGWNRPWGPGPVWHKRGDWFFYGLFWEGMPDLNYNHAPVRDEMLKIAKFWIDQGADGYRLDAIRYLYEEGKDQQADLASTHAWLKELSGTLRRQNAEVALVGEAWTETRNVVPYYGNGDELDLAFGFDEASGILEAVKTGRAKPLAQALTQVAEAYPERRFSAPFLTNHDMDRVATILKSEPAKLKLAVSTLLSLPGTPFLYQGEEIGLTQGERPGDEGKRTPMQWDSSKMAGFTTGSPWNPLSGNQAKISVAAQQGDAGSLLNHYKRLLRLRKASPALRHGDIIHGFQAAAEGPSLSFARVLGGDLVVCLFNFSDKAAAVGMTLDRSLLERAGLGAVTPRAVDLLTDKAIPVKTGAAGAGYSVTVPSLAPRTAVWARISGA